MSTPPTQLEIDKRTYKWCTRMFSVFEKRLGLHIQLHNTDEQFGKGQIFLFNHFARFETIIPQYYIYKHTGKYCRSIASHKFFSSDRISSLLYGLGVVPNNYSRLLPFLAAEILRGRKVVVFPEGGMIKDRKVVNDKGHFRIFSPTSQEERKHHQGAAAIGLMLEIFKQRIRYVAKQNQVDRLQRWTDALGLSSIDALLEAAAEPTNIVPCNITFYPLRAEEHVLSKTLSRLGVDMSDRMQEELLIEGNILLRETDMHIRAAEPVTPQLPWPFRDHRLLSRIFSRVQSLDDLFEIQGKSQHWLDRLFNTTTRLRSAAIRDLCTKRMYSAITLHFGHIVASVLLALYAQGIKRISTQSLYTTIYAVIKQLQTVQSLYLHPDLRNPNNYTGLINSSPCPDMRQFEKTAIKCSLLDIADEHHLLLPKLGETPSLANIRKEGFLFVYANESEPVKPLGNIIKKILGNKRHLTKLALANYRFNDMLLLFQQQKEHYSGPDYTEINAEETASESGEPFLLLPKLANVGIVLVHGFMASPAEMLPLGKYLYAQGYAVLGVRLAGHGTSPANLRDTDWEDWMGSLHDGMELMHGLVDQVIPIGFSTGAMLTLLMAAKTKTPILALVSVSAPFEFAQKSLALIPIIHGLNKLTQWVSDSEGVYPYRKNNPEHPEVNYKNIPIRSVLQLMQLVEATKQELKKIHVPVCILHADKDPVIAPKSAFELESSVGSQTKLLEFIPATHHGIIYRGTGNIYQKITAFIESHTQ